MRVGRPKRRYTPRTRFCSALDSIMGSMPKMCIRDSYSVAILDALRLCSVPAVEVMLDAPDEREPFLSLIHI